MMQVKNNYKSLDNYIAHIGFGAFHRSHQAYYTDITNGLINEKWSICAVSLFSGKKIIENLKNQNYCFSVLEKGTDNVNLYAIKAVVEGLHPEHVGIDNLIHRLTEPEIKIISLTLTEKGYCIAPQSGLLDTNNELIKHDLLNPYQPKSAIGVLVAVLRKRMENNQPPLTILSCDNISENGNATRNVVLDYARHINNDFANWIDKNTSFPNTMVDCIVPAMTQEGRHEIEKLLGKEDYCGVICEDFRQWIIEDDFISGRPQWEKAGVQFVKDVLPYEEMKLRMLNGSHSFLAYVGCLMGYEYIDDCMQDSYLKKAIKELMHEQSSTLNPELDINIKEYSRQLLERFSNPNIKHKTSQIAMDGSQKLPQRAVDSLKKITDNNIHPKWLPFLIASWMHFVRGRDGTGKIFEVVDPLVKKINKLSAQEGDKYVDALLGLEGVFGSQDTQSLLFVASIKLAYKNIAKNGISQALYYNLEREYNYD